MHGLTLTLNIAPSRWLQLASVAMHSLAAIAVLLADLDWRLKGLPLLAVMVGLSLSLRLQALHEIRCEPDGSLQIRVAVEWQAATLLPASVVMPWLVVLHYRVEENSRTHHLVILPDSLPSDDFRRLRVWLKWKATVAGDASLLRLTERQSLRINNNHGKTMGTETGIARIER